MNVSVGFGGFFVLFFFALYLLCATFSAGRVNTNIIRSSILGFFFVSSYNKLAGKSAAGGQSAQL